MDEFMPSNEDADVTATGFCPEEQQVSGLQVIQGHFFYLGQLHP